MIKSAEHYHYTVTIGFGDSSFSREIDRTSRQRFKEVSWMQKRMFFLICSLFVSSCHYSGRLVEKQEVTVGSGTVPYRAGTVPYRNDDKAAARRDDALRKIAKFCGSDGYTVIREGSSPTASNVSEVDFRCGQGPTASASVGALAQPKNSATPGGTPITANPNVAPTPSDVDRR